MASKAAAQARSYVPRARVESDVRALVEAARGTARLQAIPVVAITPNPRNPRSTFPEQALDELAASLREDGQLQPVLVRVLPASSAAPDGPRYELIAGQRRWLAAQRAGLETIQAAVWDVFDQESLRLALIENWHRQGLTAAEQVAGLEALAEAVGNVGVRDLARRLRVAPSTISERLKVRCDPLVWPALEAGQIPLGHAFRLRRAPALARPHLVQRVLLERPSRETLEEWIEDARGEHRRAGAHAAIAVARGEGEPAGVRQSNTSPQAVAGQQYLEALATGLDPLARDVASTVFARLRDLLSAASEGGTPTQLA